MKGKSGNMFKKLKSIETDFSLFQQLVVINKNILYVTHQVDIIKKQIDSILTNDNLQKQVDDFYKTSPQTDTDEQ